MSVSSDSKVTPADAPLVLLIGAPLPPPYGGIARYMQLCLPAMARKGFRVRVLQPYQGIEPHTLAGLPLDADVKADVFSYPGVVRLVGWFLRRPATALRLFAWYAPALLRRPRFSTRQLAATACWIRSAEVLAKNGPRSSTPSIGPGHRGRRQSRSRTVTVARA